MPTKARPIRERFWEKAAIQPSEDGCWLWLSNTDSDGYGLFLVRKGVTARAHRMAWELAHAEEIPVGLFVCHRCDNPACIRPDHLFLGTVQENRADCIAKGRHAHGAKHSARPNSNARVTADQVRCIRGRVGAGEPQKNLCAEFGMSPAAISMIVHGQRWKHVA
jgi:hypothetical protein